MYGKLTATDRRPHHAESPQPDFLAIPVHGIPAEHAEPDPPSTHQPDLDPRLEAICLKAMAKRPEDRYASMADFAQALTELLKTGQLVDRARRASPAETPDRQVSPTPAESAWPSAPTLVDAHVVVGSPPVAKVARPGAGPQSVGRKYSSGSIAEHPPQPKPVLLRHHLARVPFWAWIASGGAAAVILLGIILYVETNYGTVKLELSDPTAKVAVQIDGQTIGITGLDRPLRLQPGEHGLVVTGDDFETVTRSFTVKRGSDEVLRVTLVPKPEQIAQTPPTPPVELKPVGPPAAPLPAVLRVQISPPEALLTANGKGVTVAGQGGERIVTVAEPDGKTKVVLLAVLVEHENQQIELTPAPGEEQGLTMKLTRVASSGPARGTAQESHAPKREPAPQLPPAPSGPLPTIENSIKMRLVQIPADEFLMGSADSDSEAFGEKPQHHVRITRPFHLGALEVTQAQYQQVMGSNPSNFKDDSGLLPVDNVSWTDAQEFCAKLSELPEEKQAGRLYRLPTEAEWEYGCRAGSTSCYAFDESQESLGSYAWFIENSGNKTHPVGQKKPNAWGLYDMHGNVYEWCSDWYGNYDASAVDDPRGPTAGSLRVNRGGSCGYDAGLCRPAHRARLLPGYRRYSVGFRVAFGLVDASSK